MTWTLTNLIIQIVAGILSAHAVASFMHDHAFGAVGHTIAGAVGGALSGYFLQSFVMAVERSSGFFGEPNAVELAFGQALTGVAAGGIAVMLIGLIKNAIDRGRAGRRVPGPPAPNAGQPARRPADRA